MNKEENRELFKKTEGRIYRHFKDIQALDKLKSRLVLLDKQQREIEKEIKDLKYLNLEGGIRSIDYSGEVVQSSSKYCGSCETEAENYITKLETEYSKIIERQLKTKGTIRELEYLIQDMNFNIDVLSKEEREFINLKYKECQKIDYIAVKLFGGARTTTYRKREELVWRLSGK